MNNCSKFYFRPILQVEEIKIMRGAVLTKEGIELRDVKKPTPNRDQVLIKIKSVGICGTDLSIISGDYKINLPKILGHELSGIIEEVGENVNEFITGEKVTSEINISCGDCYFCNRDQR
ncbi:MAG: alcohol dehydrogenase catalytic domain-containing protein [Candidatus Lokiarchaeota archaeon]|nr:alcohol dehydrogenase catalytic domain-containing protein [Candidatus Lokiarchaeota archaeon]